MIAGINGDISYIQNLDPKTNHQVLKESSPNECFTILVIYSQHAFNLFGFGFMALVCSFFIWSQQNRFAMLMAGVVGGCADLGVIFFIDIFGGYGSHFGRLFLLVVVTAIVLSIYITRATHSIE